MPPALRRLLELLAPLADGLAKRAPTAREELSSLQAFVVQSQGKSGAQVRQAFEDQMRRERVAAARQVSEAIRGSDLEDELVRMKASTGQRSSGGRLSASEIADIAERGRLPSAASDRQSAAPEQTTADVADGFIGFLQYMLSMRASNLDVYTQAYSTSTHAFGVTQVMGALVDFDYWIDCPPLSSHDEQLAVHALLADLHGDYFRPVVGYNPWTDINQGNAGLLRVEQALENPKFVGAKIYPPIGFMPAGNADYWPPSLKKRPDLLALDATLDAFFATCARLAIPVMAHAARSNGRDYAHDEFGGPKGWRRRLTQAAAANSVATVNLGHFGGGQGANWTQEFATLMQDLPDRALYGDLGYWEELMCAPDPGDVCLCARQRLARALDVTIGADQSVADRVMFGTDWLMLSQVKGWADYPALVHESIAAISAAASSRIFGLNAQQCFGRLRPSADSANPSVT